MILDPQDELVGVDGRLDEDRCLARAELRLELAIGTSGAQLPIQIAADKIIGREEAMQRLPRRKSMR